MDRNSPIDEIYKRYARSVRQYVLSLCKNFDTADDITAETFLKAMNGIDSFKGGNMLTWLCTIAKNTYFDYAAKKERKNLPLPDEQIEASLPSPEASAEKKEDEMLLYHSMQSLGAEAREVVYLKMFTELSFHEIGEILGKSENWSRVVFYRSKNKLKGLINNEN